MVACRYPGSPCSIPFKYEIFVCAAFHIEDRKTTKSATWPDYCLRSGFFIEIIFLRCHCGMHQTLAILSVHHFMLITFITHHLTRSRSQKHIFGNSVAAMWLTQLFNHKLKAWLHPESVHLFKVQTFVNFFRDSKKLAGFTAALKQAVNLFIKIPEIKGGETSNTTGHERNY